MQKALQATASEGLVQGLYMAARVGFKPAILRTQDADHTTEPPRPTWLWRILVVYLFKPAGDDDSESLRHESSNASVKTGSSTRLMTTKDYTEENEYLKNRIDEQSKTIAMLRQKEVDQNLVALVRTLIIIITSESIKVRLV